MKGRILLAWFAVFLALPAGAAATNTPELTYPTGTRLATEQPIRGVGVGESKFTSVSNTITCASASLTGKLTKNSGTEVEATIESAAFTNSGGECSNFAGTTVNTKPATNGVPWCYRSTPEMAEDEFQIRGGGCSEAVRPIRLDTVTTTTTWSECVYEKTGAISGTFKTHPEDALLTSSEVTYNKVSGAITCPGSTKLDTTLTFEKDEGTTNPLYVSAGPLLTFPTGTALSVGSKVRGRNVGELKITTSLGTTGCTGVELTGTLKKNSGTAIEVDIESGSIFGDGNGGTTCTSPTGNVTWTLKPSTNGLPWCLVATSKMAADSFEIHGNNCASGARPIRMISETDFIIADECHYERAAALAGTYKTHPEDAVLSFTNATFLESEPKSGSCPDETQLDSSLTLERNEAGTHPMYIS